MGRGLGLEQGGIGNFLRACCDATAGNEHSPPPSITNRQPTSKQASQNAQFLATQRSACSFAT